jgi:hypothetical protein
MVRIWLNPIRTEGTGRVRAMSKAFSSIAMAVRRETASNRLRALFLLCDDIITLLTGRADDESSPVGSTYDDPFCDPPLLFTDFKRAAGLSHPDTPAGDLHRMCPDGKFSVLVQRNRQGLPGSLDDQLPDSRRDPFPLAQCNPTKKSHQKKKSHEKEKIVFSYPFHVLSLL